MNKKSLEDKIWSFIDKKIYIIYFLLVTIMAVMIRYLLFKYESGDYTMFLKPWFDELKFYGGLAGLSQNIGNYTPIYMTILALLTYLPISSLTSIKIVSVIFDFLGAIYAYKIVMELLKDKKNNRIIALVIYGLYLVLPTVFLNSAYWAQSDGIYTAFIIVSLYYLIKSNFIKGIIFFAIALSFKFQAIFIFPLYVLMYFNNRKFKFRYFLLIPLIIFIFSIPKVIATGDFLSGFNIYVSQSSTYDSYLTLNLPNVYSIYLFNQGSSNLINSPFKEMGTVGIVFTLMIFVTIAFLVYKKKIKFEKNVIIDFGLWSILICTFFLPQMHERYLFMADVISLLYFVIHKDRYYIPIIIEIISLNGYMYLLFSGFAVNFSSLGILFFIMLTFYSKDMVKRYFIERS